MLILIGIPFSFHVHVATHFQIMKMRVKTNGSHHLVVSVTVRSGLSNRIMTQVNHVTLDTRPL